MAMLLTIDASVAIKWILEEPGSPEARSYLASYENLEGGIIEYTFVAPSLIALEIHNTVAKKYRRGEATFEQLAECEFATKFFGQIEPIDDELIRTARHMSFVARHWSATRERRPRPDLGAVFNIYDCIYIAHARRHKSTLLTADQQQSEMARVFDVRVEFISAG
jgi:predicted nucleic acid-binding protein